MSSLPHPHPAPPSAMPVWLVGGAGAPVILALYLAGAGSLLRLAVPAVAFAVALALYFRRPMRYLQFTLWTWFLTPLVRRLVDFRCGFQDQNLVLLAPFLVSAISALTLLRERRNVSSARLAPFYLCIAGILYGFCVGMIRWKLAAANAVSPSEVAFGLLNWLVPLLFGLHLFLDSSRDDVQAFSYLQPTFLWATLLTSVYGVYQYLAPPAWDRFWLESLPGALEASSFGRPYPFEVRVWSTLNAPGPFSDLLLVGLILLLQSRWVLKPAGAIAGVIALTLSVVRAAWLSLAVGIVAFLRYMSPRQRVRVIAGTVLAILLAASLITVPQARDMVIERLNTLTDLKNDGSVRERTLMYSAMGREIRENPSGLGLRNGIVLEGFPIDSGLVATLLSLGWCGSLLLGIGLCSTFSFRARPIDRDIPLYGASHAICLSLLLQLVAGNTFVGFTGVLFWTFFSMRLTTVPVHSGSAVLHQQVRSANA
jgi:hypothetical protein